MNSENVWDRGRWANVSAVEFDYMTQTILGQILACIDPAGCTVCELGAGMGRLGYRLLEHGASHVTMVDNSEKARGLIVDLFNDIDTARYAVVDANVLDFAAERPFDLVLSSGLIEHFDGDRRRAIVHAHTRLAARDCVIVHPSNRLYNRVFDRTPMARKRYGFARTFSEAELEAHLRADPRVQSVRHRRFHLFYTVPGLHNSSTANRIGAPLASRWGGLCITRATLASPDAA